MTDGHVVVRRRAIQRSVAHAYRAGATVTLDWTPRLPRLGAEDPPERCHTVRMGSCGCLAHP